MNKRGATRNQPPLGGNAYEWLALIGISAGLGLMMWYGALGGVTA